MKYMVCENTKEQYAGKLVRDLEPEVAVNLVLSLLNTTEVEELTGASYQTVRNIMKGRVNIKDEWFDALYAWYDEVSNTAMDQYANPDNYKAIYTDDDVRVVEERFRAYQNEVAKAQKDFNRSVRRSLSAMRKNAPSVESVDDVIPNAPHTKQILEKKDFHNNVERVEGVIYRMYGKDIRRHPLVNNATLVRYSNEELETGYTKDNQRIYPDYEYQENGEIYPLEELIDIRAEKMNELLPAKPAKTAPDKPNLKQMLENKLLFETDEEVKAQYERDLAKWQNYDKNVKAYQDRVAKLREKYDFL